MGAKRPHWKGLAGKPPVEAYAAAPALLVPPNLRNQQWCPSPMRPATTIGALGAVYALWMDPVGGVKFWGRSTADFQLRESSDAAQTWSNVGAAFPAAIAGVRNTADGQLLVSTSNVPGVSPGRLYRSTNYGVAALGATAFELVLSADNHTALFTNDWGMSAPIPSPVCTMTEYGNKTGGLYGSRMWASWENGKANTWRLVHTHDQSEGAHSHGGCWDPFDGRLIKVEGDGPFNAIDYSDDRGVTWKALVRGMTGDASRMHCTAYGAIQPVAVIALRDCLLFGMDSAPNGIGRVPRLGKGRQPYFEAAIVTELADTVMSISGQPYWRGDGHPVYFPIYRTGSAGRSLVVGSMDGHDFHVVYRDTTSQSVADGMLTYHGPTSAGKNVGVRRVGAQYQRTECTAPLWQQRNNRAPQVRLVKHVRFPGPYATGGDAVLNTQIDCNVDALMQANLADRTFRWRGSFDSLQPGGITQQAMIGSHTANQNFYFVIKNADRKAELLWWQQDGTIRNTQSDVLPFADKEIFTIEVQVDVDNGAAGRTTTWRTSTDYDPKNREESAGTWTSLGGGGAVAGVTNFRHLSAPVSIGAYSGGSGGRMIGNFEWAEIRAGLGDAGVVLLDPDAREPQTRLGEARHAGDPQSTELLRDSGGTVWFFQGLSQARVRARFELEPMDWVDRPAALTAASASAINSGDATTDAVIGNMRTRLNELEARLRLLRVIP